MWAAGAEPLKEQQIPSYWVALKELKFSYHSGYIYKIMGFPQYSNLS